MTSLTASPEITSSITLPNISRSTEDNGTLEFQIDNVNTSIVNAIRRTLLSDILVSYLKLFLIQTIKPPFIKILADFIMKF